MAFVTHWLVHARLLGGAYSWVVGSRVQTLIQGRLDGPRLLARIAIFISTQNIQSSVIHQSVRSDRYVIIEPPVTPSRR